MGVIMEPTMYNDAKSFVRRCNQCQSHENINTRDAMPLILNLQIDIFDVWGIDFMGPFPNSEGCEYILVVVDYVSKWVECNTLIFPKEIIPIIYIPK
jgi:hypothetical protein